MKDQLATIFKLIKTNKDKIKDKDLAEVKKAMPKISPIKGHNDSSFQIENIPTRNLSKIREEAPVPIIRAKQTSFYDSVVPIYEVNYDPEFSKSPLASVEMSRKEKPVKYAPVLPQLDEEPEERSHVIKRQDDFQFKDQKCHWKTILCWVGIGLGIIAFIVGLYFLVDTVLGKNSPQEKTEVSNQNITYTSGIIPIYVNPIPYNSMSSSSPSTSVSAAPITRPQQTYTSGTTSPSVLPGFSTPTLNQTRKPTPIKPTTSKLDTITAKKPQASTQWSVDPMENSIEPLNAYEKFSDDINAKTH